MRCWLALLVVAFGAVAAGCGGGGHGAALPPTATAVGGTVVAGAAGVAAVTSTVTMHVNIPTTGSAAAARRAQTIPAATQSISIAVNGGTAQAFNASGSSITAAIAAPLGSDTFNVVAYDAQNGAGNILAAGSATATINSNQANTVAIVLTATTASPSPTASPAVPASITLTVSVPQPAPTGTSQAIAITLVARDASNNVITGTYSAPFTLTSSDTTHFPVSAGATIPNSTTVAVVTYDGSCGPPATITIGGPVTGSTTIGTNRHVLTTFADSGAGSLRSYLTGATSGDIIVGNTSGTITLASSLPAFAGNYSVCGAPGINLVVDGAGAYQMFQVAATALFQNLTLQNGQVAGAAGSYITGTGAGTITVNAVKLVGGVAATGSGAIRTTGPTLTIANSTIDNNTGQVGAAILVTGGTLNLSGTTFAANNSLGNAGAIETAGGANLSVSNCTFSSNTAGGNGGAILINGGGVSTITGSTFTTNSVTGSGGAIEYAGTSTSLTIGTSSFTSNTATSAGGALYFVPAGGTATISQSSFSLNQVTAAGDGGAAYIGGQTTLITNSTFYANTAYTNGGGVAAEGGTAEIDFSTFYGNTATNNTGGSIYNSGAATNLILWANIIQNGTSLNAIARRPQAAKPPPAQDIWGDFDDYGEDFVGDIHFGAGNSQTLITGTSEVGRTSSSLAATLAGSPGYLSITSGVGDPAVGSLAQATCQGGLGPFPGVTVDQRGQPRPDAVAGFCSAGAYEPP